MKQQYPWLPHEILQHYLTHYGTYISLLLDNKHAINDLGQHFGSTLYSAEIDYLLTTEWATNSDDILWRRTKYGLHLSPDQINNVKQYLNEQ